MHNRVNLLRGIVAGLLVLFGLLVAIPVNVISGYLPGTVTGHRALWIGLLIGAAAVMIGLTWLSGRLSEQARRVRLPSVLAESGWVDREQVSEVVALLTVRDARAVGITAMTGLTGAGGFGKTTLAEMVRADPRVMKRFAGGSLKLTVGQGVHGVALAKKINDVTRRLSQDSPGYSDPEIAGQHLMGLLDTGPRRLLVVDDVWSAEQLIPFRAGGRRCALVVTTRVPDLLPGDAHRVQVDQMSAEQARQMITARHSGMLPDALVEDLISVTGRWPLLLSLVGGRLATVAAEPDGDVVTAAQRTVEQITSYGPAALDVTVDNDRTRAVSVNIGLSLDMLPVGGRDRFAELGIFAAETPVPVWVIARLWAVAAGMSERDSHALCQAMGQLSLVRYRADSDTIEMHEVIRTYMQVLLGERLSGMHAALLDGLSNASMLAASLISDNEPGVLAWWRLPGEQGYLLDNLARHIAATGQSTQFDQAITDLRWIGARLVRSGPAGPLADLSYSKTSRATALARELVRNEHLLAPTIPIRCVSDVLLSTHSLGFGAYEETEAPLAEIAG